MPIHLPPLNRRQFLTRSLLAGAGLSFGRNLVAAEPPVDPHSWALLSDPHIAANPALVARGVNMADNLTAVGRELAALKTRPAGVLVNGDCAYLMGETGDYETFAKLLKPIRAAQMPVHLTLGNHDERERFWSVLVKGGAGKHALTDRHVSLVRSPRANLFLLDSLDHVNVAPGLLGDAQRAWLAKTLDDNQDKPALIIAHHNLADGKSKGALQDTEKLIELLTPRTQVKAYIFGHTHNWEVSEHASGIHLVNLPPVAYVFKDGNPNGWVHLSLTPDGARLKFSSLDKQHAAHGRIVDLKWRA